MLDADLLVLAGMASAACVTSVVMMRNLYIALGHERSERARELQKFEDAIREARASLLDLDVPAPRTVAEPEPLLDVGGYRSNPRPAPVLAVRAVAPSPPAWHLAPVASMLREF